MKCEICRLDIPKDYLIIVTQASEEFPSGISPVAEYCKNCKEIGDKMW